MKMCENCKYSEPIGGGLACMGQKGMPFVIASDYCENWKTTKQTNADRIRAMSDEELARFLYNNSDGQCPAIEHCPTPTAPQNCPDGHCWLDWLRQEATE